MTDGVRLHPVDMLKAEILACVPAEQHQGIADMWEACSFQPTLLLNKMANAGMHAV